MKIPLDGEFFIKTDTYNFDLVKTVTSDSGNEYDKCLGHYGTIQQAMKGYIQKVLLTGSFKFQEEVLARLDQCQQAIDKAAVIFQQVLEQTKAIKAGQKEN